MTVSDAAHSDKTETVWSRDEERLVRPFYDAARRAQLVLPKCPDCGRYHWYPSPVCPHCQAPGWDWRPVASEATLFTWTVVNHAFNESLRGAVPFVTALVELAAAPGVRLVTNIVDCDVGALRAGMPLVADFRKPVWSAHVLPVFKPAPAERD